MDQQIWNAAIDGHHLLTKGWPLVLQLNRRQLRAIDDLGHGQTLRNTVRRCLERRLEDWWDIIHGRQVSDISCQNDIGAGLRINQGKEGDILFHYENGDVVLRGNVIKLPVVLPETVKETLPRMTVTDIVEGLGPIAGPDRRITGHRSDQQGMTILELEREHLSDVSYRDLFGEPVRVGNRQEKRAA